MKPSDVKVKVELPATWTDHVPITSGEPIHLVEEEGLIFVFWVGRGGPGHRLTFTKAGLARFAEHAAAHLGRSMAECAPEGEDG